MSLVIGLRRAASAFFSKLTPNLMPTLRERLWQTRQAQVLQEYLEPDNVEPLFDLVIHSRLAHPAANRALDQLLPLCSTENDQQINILANILKQKAINDARAGDTPAAISHFQQALSTVLLMDNPNQLVLSQIYKFIADLSVQVNELKKGEQALRQAEHLLLDLGQEGSAQADSGLACIYTQLSMIKYREKKPTESLEELKKALLHWERVSQKIPQEYELSCRLKCMLHLLFKEDDQAVGAAKEFLSFLSEACEGKAWTVSRLYFLNIVCMFQEGSPMEEEVVELLREFRGRRGGEKTQELMIMVGIQPDRYSL